MTSRKVSFEIESFDQFKARSFAMARALDRGEDLAPETHLSFADMETLLTVLTPKRFALLRALRQAGPQSVRALAVKVARDYKSVHTDVAALLSHGLVAREAKDRIAVYWDHVSADFRLAA